MKVQILTHTPNPELLISQAAKLCYSAVGIDELSKKLTEDEVDRFISHLVSISHLSPFEHASFTFAVEDVSRTLTHQLVRHRICSYSQQSQRYVDMKNPEFIVPESILNSSEASEIFDKVMQSIDEAYESLLDIGIAKEDARSVLPNATPSKIIFTMNVRSLLNFFELRCCDRAEAPIREMANEMLKQVKEISPILFKTAGASCVKGKCPEGSKSCGNPKGKIK